MFLRSYITLSLSALHLTKLLKNLSFLHGMSTLQSFHLDKMCKTTQTLCGSTFGGRLKNEKNLKTSLGLWSQKMKVTMTYQKKMKINLKISLTRLPKIMKNNSRCSELLSGSSSASTYFLTLWHLTLHTRLENIMKKISLLLKRC